MSSSWSATTPDERHFSGARYAKWGSRVAAEVVDTVVIAVVANGLNVASGRPSITRIGALTAIVSVVYNTLGDGGRKGQTVGKRFLAIRTVRAAGGGRLGYARGALRSVAGLAAVTILRGALPRGALQVAVTGSVGLVDVLWPLWDRRRQTLHDKVAGSVVVNDDQPPRRRGADARRISRS